MDFLIICYSFGIIRRVYNNKFRNQFACGLKFLFFSRQIRSLKAITHLIQTRPVALQLYVGWVYVLYFSVSLKFQIRLFVYSYSCNCTNKTNILRYTDIRFKFGVTI